MFKKTLHSRALWLGAAALVLITMIPAGASSGGEWNQLDRWDPATPSPTGQSVAVECNPDSADHPETWPNAEARIRLNERHGTSRLIFRVRNARPNTLYTVWLRLLGEDSEGNLFGGSPLTGLPVTPLVASADLPVQLAATLPNLGSDNLSNGFHTNARGNGRVRLAVDLPISSGAYPFQRFPNFEQLKTDIALTNADNLARLGGDPAAIRPVAIPDGSQAPVTILVASHCTYGLSDG